MAAGLMDNFLLIQDTANILGSIPPLQAYTTHSEIIRPFPHIREFGNLEFNKIVRGSLLLHYNSGIEICYVIKGRYEWTVEESLYRLYPGDAFITCPWQQHGSPSGLMDMGSLMWIIIAPENFQPDGLLRLGEWSPLTAKEEEELGSVLAKNTYSLIRQERIGEILQELYLELRQQCLGYRSRVNQLIIDLLLFTMRNATQHQREQKNSLLDFDRLEKTLKSDLSMNWTIEEMAQIVGLKTTAFNDKMKRATGFTPNHYLILLRLERAKKLLQESCEDLTTIALECGFYSSQHFSNTFKRWEGLTPRDFRKERRSK